MLKMFFTNVYHFIWYAFAFIVLNAAVLVTVVRLALPEIGGYKEEIQSWVSEYMDYPLVIDEINAEWQGWAPHLYLKNIDLYTVDNSSLITKFDSAHLGIDLLSSINKRELVPSHLSISGLNLEFIRNIDGSISISNDNNINAGTDNNAALSEWLLKQKHIMLVDASLTWHDKKSSKEKIKFSNVQLELKTHKQRAQVEVNIPLPEQYGQSLTLKMDVNGNILTPNWEGTIYMEAKDFNLSHLFDDSPVRSLAGNANTSLWTKWEQAKLVNISGEINYTDFSLNTDQYKLPISNVDLTLRGERIQDQNWLFNITVEDLRTANGIWPTSNHQVKLDKNTGEDTYQYSGHLSYLKIEDILPFIVASDIIPKNVLKEIHWQSVEGELINTSFNLDPEAGMETPFSFNTSFNNFTISSIDKNNSISGLEGEITANNQSTIINLDSNFSEINLGAIFNKAYPLSAINAELELLNKDTAELLINKLHIEDKNISLETSGKIIFEEASPYIDVVMHMDETSIELLPLYLPRQTPVDLKRWFEEALLGGQLLSADLIFHGSAIDFPFKNSKGIFKAIMNVENATFGYAEGWPPIDNLSAEVIVDNNDLFVSANSGYIFDATIEAFKANIMDMEIHNPHVIVNGTIKGHTNDAGHFINQSPLKENSTLAELTENIYGSINLKLNLDIPIDVGDTAVEGIVRFSDTTLESDLPGLSLEGLNGDVSFTEQIVWANDIDALYHSRPVKLNIPDFDSDKSDYQSYIISGLADKEFVISQLTSFFPSLLSKSQSISNYFSGESNWSLTLKRMTGDETTVHREVEFNANLKGITINLPHPIGKTTDETKALNIKTTLTDLSIDAININYDNNIYVDFFVDNTEDLLVKNIHIGLGQQHPLTSNVSHISVLGQLEELNVSDWIDYIEPEKPPSSQNNDEEKQKTFSGNVYIKKFNMLGNDFSNVNLNLSKPTDGWQVIFDSEQLKGQTNFITSDNGRLHANFEKFTLSESDNNNEDEKNRQIAINKIPDLEVDVEHFIYNGNELGQLNLLTSKIDKGISINNLSITKPGFNIKAKGEWTRVDNVDRSDFHATLEADSIETMLGTFNFNTANIADGQTKIEMNAYWMDTPMNFAMEKIDGDLDMKIGKGQFLNIDPSAGRLFGLLSIQTLARRLTLDFTDLFNEGFAFDNIEGSFSLQQGHAYTNNLEMSGPAANVIVSGRTGLATEDYDQIATVRPTISSGIPVASALFGPIGIGVGAVIYIAGEIFKFIPEKIDNMLSRQYTITGSWDNPSIEKVEEEKDSS